MQSMQERINNMQSNGGGGGALPATAPTSKGILESSLPKLRDTLIEGMGGTVPNTAVGLQAVPPGAPPPPGFPASAMNASGTAAPAAGGAEGATAAPTSGGPVIQVVGNDKKSSSSSAAKKESAPAYIPSGSNFEAVLMTGMDASTSISANRNPTPALLRVKSDAILPNMFNFSVRECFVMVGGFGNMSSERVEMRTENMSCISEDGSVYEGKIEAYLVGEDGKAGARGRVVSKQGALLAKGFMAGFVGGIGQAFQPQPIQALNVNATGGSSPGYQFPNGDQVLGNAISSGLNRSGTALANFYIKLAEQMFPVVELDAGRKMTIVLLKGVELKMESKR
jgi:conjugal transfer pilus assembly protein TraB